MAVVRNPQRGVFISVCWESTPVAAINLNSWTNQRRRNDKASASPITTKQIGVLWCCCKSTKRIYHNNCEEVIFRRAHSAPSGEQTDLLRYSHSLKRHAVHSWGEDVLQTLSFSLRAWKKKKTHFDTYYDKRGWKRLLQCLLQERLGLLKGGDNKSSLLSARARYANGSRIPSGLCGTIVSSGPHLPGGETCLFWQSVPQRVTNTFSHANYNGQWSHVDRTSRIVLASRRGEPAATSSQSPLNCTAARQI